MTSVVLATVVLLTIMVGCEQHSDLNLDFSDRTTPTFDISGGSLAKEFEILELPPTKPISKINPFSYTGEVIWNISAPESIEGGKWPPLSYGDVPNGFSQSVPEHGPPPRLARDKLYVARIVGEKNNKTAMFFEIRNGKAVNVTDEVFGP